MSGNRIFMIKWFYYWDEWRKAYWSLIDNYPELFAFLHRMYVFQHSDELGQLDKRDSLIRIKAADISSRIDNKLHRKVVDRNKSEPSVSNSSPAEPVGQYTQADVLFYTHSNRDTCLGVGEKLFDAIRDKQLDISCAFYQNDRHRILNSSQHRGIPVITLDVTPTLKGVVRFFRLLPIVYSHGLKSKVVAKFIFRHPLVALVNLLKISMTTACIEQMLESVNPKILLSCNEQGGADASIMFALAKKMGIHTIQYMHAVPTKQFVPFICDEYWSWSELTTRMLMGEMEDKRVINMGSLEHENRASVSVQCDLVPSEEHRVLFLAQMGMDEEWGIHANVEGMDKFCEGLRMYSGQVKLRVREHPYAGTKEREMLEKVMSDIPYEITTKESPLSKDVEWATHVYSICSNAIFAALLGGKPAYLIWNNELNEIYGRPFFPSSCIVGSASEFVETLNDPVEKDNSESIIQQVLGMPGAVDRAVSRIEQIAGVC